MAGEVAEASVRSEAGGQAGAPGVAAAEGVAFEVPDGMLPPMSEADARRMTILRSVAVAVQDGAPYVLKGGSGLAFSRGLPRWSDDLDFDAPRALAIGRRIEEGVRRAGATPVAMTLAKDTGTVQRFKLRYEDEAAGGVVAARVETSFRRPPVAGDTEAAGGVRVYRVPVQLAQKLDAIEHRTEARDLFDAWFLLARHGGEIGPVLAARADALTRDEVGLADAYRAAFEQDARLAALGAETVVLALREAIEAAKDRGR